MENKKIEESQTKITGFFARKFNPFYSYRHFRHLNKNKLFNINPIRINDNEERLVLLDNQKYVPFLQIYRKSTNDYPIKPGAIFAVIFHSDSYTVEKGLKIAQKRVALFAGLPGFQAKTYYVCLESSWYAGLYCWESVEAANRYAHSYAYTIMSKRSSKHKVKYQIIDITKKSIVHPYWKQNYEEILELIGWKKISSSE
ncbi:MAG: hypothetical protein P8Y70_09585 [Candidatus Lokiarchaeota archaeon]